MTDLNIPDLSPRPQEYPLPCRGCSSSCPHYHSCEGKPWRMDAEIVKHPAELTRPLDS